MSTSKLKAVKITKDNKSTLESQYGMSEDFLEYSSGLYLIAGFGNTQYEALLTKTALEANFIRGAVLRNGFFELERKLSEPIAAVTTV